MKRISFYILFLLSFLIGLNSCLENNNGVTYSEDAEITTFRLYSPSSDSVYQYYFTINQDNGTISNTDSLPYLTRIDSLYPVLSPTFIKVMLNDSIPYQAKDSIFLNFAEPVTIEVWSENKKKSKKYTITVNVHQVDPDTFIWEGIKTQIFGRPTVSERAFYPDSSFVFLAAFESEFNIYFSQDAVNWRESNALLPDFDLSTLNLRENCAYNDSTIYIYQNGNLFITTNGLQWEKRAVSAVNSLLFSMNGNLYALQDVDGETKVVVYDGNNGWNVVTTAPTGFPVSGYSILVSRSPSGAERAFVLGGIDADANFLSSLWSTENGSYWSNLTSGRNQISPRADALLVQYANGLMIFGGRDENGVLTEQRHLFSKDYGLTWKYPDSKMEIPSLYAPRYAASGLVSSSGILYLIGGRGSENTSIQDVWRAISYISMPGFVK